MVYSGEDDMNALIIGMHQEAVNTYKKLADELLASEYFMLLSAVQRERIMESFDYVIITDTYLDANEDHDLSEEEVAPIIAELITLYEEFTGTIGELQDILDKK